MMLGAGVEANYFAQREYIRAASAVSSVFWRSEPSSVWQY